MLFDFFFFLLSLSLLLSVNPVPPCNSNQISLILQMYELHNGEWEDCRPYLSLVMVILSVFKVKPSFRCPGHYSTRLEWYMSLFLLRPLIHT